MKLTMMLKLQTTSEQHDALLRTMEAFNRACNCVADKAFAAGTANKYRLQKLVYHDIRKTYGLSSQMAIRVIAKVCEAYKRDRSVKPTFALHGAMVYDQRILSWKGPDRASILTLAGRIVVPYVVGAYQQERLAAYGVRGQADLIYRDGVFYLAVVIDLPEPPEFDPTGWLGVDLGIVNIATDSDGEVFSGGKVNGLRKRYAKLRARLQSKGTRSAKRLLRKRRRKEARFARDVNHTISKRLVAKALDTARGIALEDLTGIRERVTVRKAQRRVHDSWSFYQLRTFLEYKARLAGVPVLPVDPRNTSRTCPMCGTIDKRNRPTQARFLCIECGFAGPADTIAAGNIACRAGVMRPHVTLQEQLQATRL